MKENRIEREKRIISKMITLFCLKKEGNSVMCSMCLELQRYAHDRLSHCPLGDRKSSCKNCKIHCYNSVMREKMKEVMRFSGPRMIFYAPLDTIWHLIH